MKIKEYENVVLGLAKYPNVGNNFVYPTLGLVGEAGEFAEKVAEVKRKHRDIDYTYEDCTSLAKELGDVLWYVASCARELGLSIDKLPNQPSHFSDFRSFSPRRLGLVPDLLLALKLTANTGKFSDKIKKIIRDKDSIVLVADREELRHILSKVLTCICDCAEDLGTNMVTVATMNVEKLLSRNARNVIQGEGDDR